MPFLMPPPPMSMMTFRRLIVYNIDLRSFMEFYRIRENNCINIPINELRNVYNMPNNTFENKFNVPKFNRNDSLVLYSNTIQDLKRATFMFKSWDFTDIKTRTLHYI